MRRPVVSTKKGDRRIDVLAVRKAAKAGTLTAQERKTVERFLPGVLEREDSPVK